MMARAIKTFGLILATGALSGCVSAAVGMLDGIAGAAADVGSRTLYSVDEEACKVDPYWLAKKGVDLDFGKNRTFSLASSKCQERFDVALNEMAFAYDFDLLVKERCTKGSGQDVRSSYCSDNVPKIDPAAAPQRAAFVPDIEKMRGYEVGNLECDNDMFKRKMNVARLAQIEGTELCLGDGGCYSKDNLVDRNRSISFGSTSSWANERDTPRVVTFTWDRPETDIEQIFIQTPEAFPLATYTIEVRTPTGQQVQVAQVLGNEGPRICHRFNPLDVESITIEGSLKPSQGSALIYLNEVVVR